MIFPSFSYLFSFLSFYDDDDKQQQEEEEEKRERTSKSINNNTKVRERERERNKTRLDSLNIVRNLLRQALHYITPTSINTYHTAKKQKEKKKFVAGENKREILEMP